MAPPDPAQLKDRTLKLRQLPYRTKHNRRLCSRIESSDEAVDSAELKRIFCRFWNAWQKEERVAAVEGNT